MEKSLHAIEGQRVKVRRVGIGVQEASERDEVSERKWVQRSEWNKGKAIRPELFINLILPLFTEPL